jgi:sugar phosphate isomerase/epimerase
VSISFSTSWVDGDIARLLSILPYVDLIEVGSKGDSGFFERVEELAMSGKLRVGSLHATAGPHKKQKETSYTPNLASDDPALQKPDIEDIFLTAEWAMKLGASNIVLHIGKIEDPKLRELFLLYRSLAVEQGGTDGLGDLRNEIVKRRATQGGRIDMVIPVLERLCRRYRKINFCFETRLHYYELPTPDEADCIFKKVSLPNLGYWHDIGHTWTLSRLGFVPMQEWQRRFGDRCRGVHIHDSGEDLTDHMPPGLGSMDMGEIIRQFENVTVYTLETNHRHTEREVLAGISYLRNLLVPSRQKNQSMSG